MQWKPEVPLYYLLSNLSVQSWVFSSHSSGNMSVSFLPHPQYLCPHTSNPIFEEYTHECALMFTMILFSPFPSLE